MPPLREDKIRVLIDLDGVVRNYVEGLVRVYRRIYPEHTIKEITSRQLEDFFPIGKKIYHFMDEQHYWEILEKAPEYPGAVEALHRWESDFEIVIATAQPLAWRYPTYVWIGKHRVPTSEVHMRYEKHTLPGVALLDDFVDNLEAFARTDRLAVCMDRPWNQHWKGPRVKSIDDFFYLVLDYLNRSERNLIDNKWLT